MDRLMLSHIDEGLGSSEVAALCFLCLDVVNKKRLEEIKDAKGLFLRLEERGLMDNGVFLFQLLHTIRRADLLPLLQTDSQPLAETDAGPTLSPYRVMLYNLYEDMTMENLEKLKFLLSTMLGRRQIEASDTALDVFVEMEKTGFLSKTNLTKLLTALQQLDQQLASAVQRYIDEVNQQSQTDQRPHDSMDYQRSVNRTTQHNQPILVVNETQPTCENIHSDAELSQHSSSLLDEAEYYTLKHHPRGWCVVFNNEKFTTPLLNNRGGSQEDEKTLHSVFSRLGFEVVIYNDLTADTIRFELNQLGRQDFINHDALVVCVLSHGDKGTVFGTDGKQISLQELTRPFTSKNAPTLAKKPKLFFIQACQGNELQGGALPCPPRLRQDETVCQGCLEEDAGRIHGERVPWDADFLLGMATVPEYKSFRNTATGSIYIQELCKQLINSAESPEMDDILTVLTRVNRNVSKGEYMSHKQMPEPKYTLTKKLVLNFV